MTQMCILPWAIALLCLASVNAHALSLSESSESALGKPDAPVSSLPPPFGFPPNRPALIQPVQYTTKQASIGSPQKAIALLKEMNQKWEGMEDPIANDNPWDSVSGQGNQGAAMSGPSTKIGTSTDPYTAMFGPWRFPPRAVPPPPMASTFLFDTNHPFRRQLPDRPDPTKNVKSNYWSPITNLTQFDVTTLPTLVMPIAPPLSQRPSLRDPYGVPGRKPNDWLYERIPTRPMIVRPQRFTGGPRGRAKGVKPGGGGKRGSAGGLLDVPVDKSYPKYQLLNPRSAFTRPARAPYDPTQPGAALHRFTTRMPTSMPAPEHKAPAPRSMEELFPASSFRPPFNRHPLRLPPLLEAAPTPTLIEQRASVRRHRTHNADDDEDDPTEHYVASRLSSALRTVLRRKRPLMVSPIKSNAIPQLIEEQATVTSKAEHAVSSELEARVGVAADAESGEAESVSRPASSLSPSKPSLLEYEVALVPNSKPRVPANHEDSDTLASAAPSSTVGADSDNTVLAETESRVTATSTSTAMSTTSAGAHAQAKTESEAEVDDGVRDLVTERRVRLQRDAERAEKEKEEAFDRSPEGKLPWWERPESVKENEARTAQTIDFAPTLKQHNSAPTSSLLEVSDQTALPDFAPQPAAAPPSPVPTPSLSLSALPTFTAPAAPSLLETESKSSVESHAAARSPPSSSSPSSLSPSASFVRVGAYSAPDFLSYVPSASASQSDDTVHPPFPSNNEATESFSLLERSATTTQTPVAPNAPSNANTNPNPTMMDQGSSLYPLLAQLGQGQSASALLEQASSPPQLAQRTTSQLPPQPPQYSNPIQNPNAALVEQGATLSAQSAAASAVLNSLSLPPAVAALLSRSQSFSSPPPPTNIIIVQGGRSDSQSEFSTRSEPTRLPPIVLA